MCGFGGVGHGKSGRGPTTTATHHSMPIYPTGGPVMNRAKRGLFEGRHIGFGNHVSFSKIQYACPCPSTTRTDPFPATEGDGCPTSSTSTLRARL